MQIPAAQASMRSHSVQKYLHADVHQSKPSELPYAYRNVHIVKMELALHIYFHIDNVPQCATMCHKCHPFLRALFS